MNRLAWVPDSVYVSASPSGSLAVTGAPTAVPAAAFSATARVADAPASKVGRPFADSSSRIVATKDAGAVRRTPSGSVPNPSVIFSSASSASCFATNVNVCSVVFSANATASFAPRPSRRNAVASPVVVTGAVTARSAELSSLTVTSSDSPSVTVAAACPYETRSSFCCRTRAAGDQSPMPSAFSARTRTFVAGAPIDASVTQAPRPQPACGCGVQPPASRTLYSTS